MLVTGDSEFDVANDVAVTADMETLLEGTEGEGMGCLDVVVGMFASIQTVICLRKKRYETARTVQNEREIEY